MNSEEIQYSIDNDLAYLPKIQRDILYCIATAFIRNQEGYSILRHRDLAEKLNRSIPNIKLHLYKLKDAGYLIHNLVTGSGHRGMAYKVIIYKKEIVFDHGMEIELSLIKEGTDRRVPVRTTLHPTGNKLPPPVESPIERYSQENSAAYNDRVARENYYNNLLNQEDDEEEEDEEDYGPGSTGY